MDQMESDFDLRARALEKAERELTLKILISESISEFKDLETEMRQTFLAARNQRTEKMKVRLEGAKQLVERYRQHDKYLEELKSVMKKKPTRKNKKAVKVATQDQQKLDTEMEMYVAKMNEEVLHEKTMTEWEDQQLKNVEEKIKLHVQRFKEIQDKDSTAQKEVAKKQGSGGPRKAWVPPNCDLVGPLSIEQKMAKQRVRFTAKFNESGTVAIKVKYDTIVGVDNGQQQVATENNNGCEQDLCSGTSVENENTGEKLACKV